MTDELVHPSIVPGDERRRRAHVLSMACGVTLTGLVLFILYYGLFDSSYNIVPMVGLLAVALYTYVINRRGQTGKASHVFVWSVLIAVLSLACVNNGIYDTALQAIPAVLIVVALLLEKRHLVIVSIFCLVSIIGIGILQAFHVLPIPSSPKTPLTDIFDIVIIDGGTVILAMLVSSYLREGLRREQLEKIAVYQSEERFRSLFQYAPVGVFYSTIAGKITLVNDEYSRILGYSSPEDVKAIVNRTTVAEAVYLRPDVRAAVIAEAAAVPGTWIKSEQQFRRKDGTLITGQLTIRVLPDNANMIEGFVEDITDRRRAASAS